MAEDNAGAGHAFPGGLCALSTHRLLLIALQLALATGKTGSILEKSVMEKVSPTYHPVRERTMFGWV